jgi:quercetin dioxygenase-like cupin family protein
MRSVPVAALPAFAQVADFAPIRRSEEHGGLGPIVFRRLLTQRDFATAVDFVDVTSIPPGSTIGVHEHHGNEELYFVLAGEPLVEVDGEARRLRAGDVAIVHSGGRHGLVNDTAQDVTIAVIQLPVAAG